MLTRIRKVQEVFRQHKRAPSPQPAGVRGQWVVNIRHTMTELPGNYQPGELYEWGLTLIEPRTGRACHIDGIWFLATAPATVDARTTIERFSQPQEIANAELIDLIEKHRLPGSPLHLTRTIDNVRQYDSFFFARAPEFMRALHWGGLG